MISILTMKNKLQLTVIFLLLSSFISISWGASSNVKDPYKHFFNETWGDLPEELIKAKQDGKKAILIFFEQDECPFCHYMKKNVLNHPKVQEFYRKHFLNFPIDIEGDIEMVNFKGKTVKLKDFAFKEHRVRVTPVIAFFDLNGKRIYRHIGKTSGIDEFIWLGEYIANGAYKKMRFSRYKRQRRAEKNK